MVTLSQSARTYIVLYATLIISTPVNAADDQRDVAVYDECSNTSCPIFQVVIKHQEKALSSRSPGPLVRPTVPTRATPLPTPALPIPVTRSPLPGGGTTVATPVAATPSTSPSEQKPSLDLAYGLYVASDSVECSKTAIVPSPVFKAVIAVLSSVRDDIDRNGSAAPALTPMQQTMLLFYTTIMQQTLNFDCSFSSAALGRPAGGSQ